MSRNLNAIRSQIAVLARDGEVVWLEAQGLMDLDDERILSPRLVELTGSVFVPDTLPGGQPGEASGLSVRVIDDPVARKPVRGRFRLERPV